MRQEIIVLFFFGTLLFIGCKNKQEHSTEHDSGTYYTCPMHPSVQSNTPGACPVCNMSLIKVEKKEESHEGHEGNFITLTGRQQLLAGIETDTVKYQTIIPGVTILGTVAIDEEQVTSINSRVDGRIDKLFVKAQGGFIRKGAPLYGIYSEELLADEREFLALSDRKRQGNIDNDLLHDMLTASKNKLRLWGVTEKQITELEHSKITSPLITFYSPSEGYVTEVSVKEGMYVREGTPLIKLARLDRVWVEAQVYSDDKINGNSLFRVFTESSPDEGYDGRLVFKNPSLEKGSKVQLLRISVENAKNQLIPGMMVYVSPKKTLQPVLAIPKSAILLEEMKTVWVKTDETTFEQRMVKTGAENKFFAEVLSGIREGETVVTAGAYLISSEFILKSGAGQRHDH
mgnify:CR=1 FL=1